MADVQLEYGYRRSRAASLRPEVPVNKDWGPPPPDKFFMVKILVLVLGLNSTLPLTFFTTASQYWMYKFRDIDSNSTAAEDRTALQANYVSASGVVSTVTGLPVSLISTFLAHKVHAKSRILYSLLPMSVIFVFNTAFVKIDTDTWQVGFFVLTLIAMGCLGLCASIGGLGNMALMTHMPKSYLHYHLAGQSVGNIFTSLLRVMSIAISPSDTSSALIYFGCGTFIMGGTTVFFYLCAQGDFMKYHLRNSELSTKRKIHSLPEILSVLKINQLWLAMFTNIAVLYSTSPGITNLVASQYYSSGSLWAVQYFPVVITYLLPGVVALIGRGISAKVHKMFSPLTLVIVSVVKTLTTNTMVLFCNAQPRKHLPVWFPYDYQYAIIIGVDSLVAGCVLNMIIVKGMRLVPEDKQELAITVTLLISGVVMFASSPITEALVNLI